MSAGKEHEGSGSDAKIGAHESETVLDGLHAEANESPPPAGDAPARGGLANLDEFSRALVDINLISDEELKNFAADSAEGVLGLSRALVKAGKLTPYQAAAVYQKKSCGLLIGNYLILEKLGQGGMGVVFKARHRRVGRVGALKILPPSFARDKSAVVRFRREVRAAGRVKHPNVVAAQDADEDRGVHFLVMDYVEGRDLDRVVRERGPLSVIEAVDYLIQAARGLEAAHAQGIIHRDIKPGNLMLDADGTVRVLDLGLAPIVDTANPFNKTTGGRLTASGMYMGTIDYMAPEQAQDSHRADHRADIYSLGCTLYYLLTGREPFPGDTVLKRMIAHRERPAPSLRTARPGIPPKLEAAYVKMMAKRPEARPASMTELISILEDCKTQAAPAKPPAGEAREPRPELMVSNETPIKPPPPATITEPSIFARRDEREGMRIDHELNLEDLVMDVRPEPLPNLAPRAPRPPAAQARPLKRPGLVTARRRTRQPGPIAVALASLALVGAAAAAILILRETKPVPESKSEKVAAKAGLDQDGNRIKLTPPPPPVVKTLFDGTTGNGWMLCDRRPVPPGNIQSDGLNPHGTGSYLLVYNQKFGDFVLDFDYKLTAGCNSGVFLRVGDLNDPVNTGIEVALDDTRRNDNRDSGGFYGLVAPRVFAQKLAGAWNHMTITAIGPRVDVVLNGQEVSTIKLDEWTARGKAPDGTDHKFKNVALAELARSGYVGFQDLGTDCWFKAVVMTSPPNSASASPPTSIACDPAGVPPH
jgi:serine/threonine protein kinase